MAYGDSASASLTAVRVAIAKCLASQSYSVGERQQRMAELKTLREMEKELVAEVAREAGGNSFGFSLAQVDGIGGMD